MAYRGEDLDLRTPPSGTRTSDLLRSPRGGYASRNEPIWVDETVLACCNLAYDMAVTHRAGEVRLEHLIYALTRIDAAAEALESRGVRVAALRRDIGGVVASDIPVGLPAGKGSPRRSDEMESVLRDAAELAQRRNAPATVEDLVAVLVDPPRELAGLIHIRRHLVSRLADRPDYEPLARRDPLPRQLPVSYEPSQWSDASRTDQVQNSRIEALEQAVRALGSDLASDRKVISNLLQNIQRDVGSRRDEDSRLSGGMLDRLTAVEHAIDKRLADLSRTWTLISDRFQHMEALLAKARSEGGGGLEVVALHDRLTGLERALQQANSEAALQWASVGDRLKSLDSAVQARALGAGSVDMKRLIDRFETIEQVVLERASEASGEAAKLAERLKVLEDGQAAQKVQTLQLNAGLAAEVSKLASAIAQLPGSDASLSLINDRFQAVSALIERQRSEIAGTLTQPVTERLQAIDARQAEYARTISTLAERLAAVERSVTGSTQKIAETSAAHEQDLSQIRDGLAKLNGQQVTLVGGMEALRQQSGEISIISNRLAAIERLSMRPAQLMEQLSEKLDSIYRLTAEKIEKRNRFIYWLFGTNNWIADSWPSRKRVTASAAAAPPRQAPPPSGPR